MFLLARRRARLFFARKTRYLACLTVQNRMLMKFGSAILIIIFLQFQVSAHSQGIDLELRNVSIEKAFSEIKKQTGIIFLYEENVIRGGKPVSLSVKNAKLKNVLDRCFKDQDFVYNIVNGTVVVSKKINVPIVELDTLITVTGTVYGEGKRLNNVSIFFKNGNKGTVTDMSGQFILHKVPKGGKIMISSIGYRQEERLADNNVLVIHMEKALTDLDQPVIIAYGKTSKRLNTGSIGNIQSAEISRQPVANVLNAMEGRIAGLYLLPGSGNPGTIVRVQLRGQNSLRGTGNEPLYIVDGVPFPSTSLSPFLIPGTGQDLSPLNLLNPADIERIEVMKDADATAIYGSRGANGVIIITTKKGTAGKPKVEFSTYAGVGKVAKYLNLLNTPQYLQMRREAFANDAVVPQSFNYDVNGTWDTTQYTDWQKELIGGTAQILNAQVAASGGSEQTQYRIALSHHKETTVYTGDFGETKNSIQFNVNHRSAGNKFTIGMSGSYLLLKNNLPQTNPMNFITLPPNAPKLYTTMGELNWENETWINPLSALNEKHNFTTSNFNSTIKTGYTVFKGLVVSIDAGANAIWNEDLLLTPKTVAPPSQRGTRENITRKGDNKLKSWILEPQINYSTKLNAHSISFLGGITFQETVRDNISFEGTGFSSESLMENLASAASLRTINAGYFQYRYNAFFGRINYNYQNKYLANITGRRDGSSRFGPGKQFSNFGAVGLAWIFSEESFIEKHLPLLSFGKLRTSYGLTGNDQIADYGYLNAYASNNMAYQGIGALSPTGLFNPSYSWESNKKFEAALELGLFKDRIAININYYRNRSSNQLVGLTLPAITGFTSIQYNLPAVVQNTGVEVEANYNILNSTFEWNTSLNVSFPKNKLVSYPFIANSPYANSYEVGKSLFLDRRFEFAGVNPQTGLYTFTDQNKDGSISSPADRVGRKERTQQYYGGWTNNLNYKNWSLNIFIQFVKQTGYNYLNSFVMPGQAYLYFGNQPVEVLNRWQKPGDITNIQQFSQGFGTAYTANDLNRFSGDHMIQDASFGRLKNVHVSYRLPDKVIKRVNIEQFQLFIQGQNLLTTSKYKGLDPQANSSGSFTLPLLRVVTGGFTIIF